MTFETSVKINKWILNHQKKCVCKFFDGAQFTYEFTPTSIRSIQSVECIKCGENIVDYVIDYKE